MLTHRHDDQHHENKTTVVITQNYLLTCQGKYIKKQIVCSFKNEGILGTLTISLSHMVVRMVPRPYQKYIPCNSLYIVDQLLTNKIKRGNMSSFCLCIKGLLDIYLIFLSSQFPYNSSICANVHYKEAILIRQCVCLQTFAKYLTVPLNPLGYKPTYCRF